MSGRRAARRLSNALPETAVVHDATTDGRGIASVSGKRVFVHGALRGETITFRRLRARSNYDEAELIGIAHPSEDRETPRCAYFGTCGGCSLQHVSARAQLGLKEATLLECLKRIGGVTPARILPPVAGPAWGYRRRARLAARFVPGKGRVLVGFSERDSARLTDMQSCETLHASVSALLGPLSGLIGSLSLTRRIPQVEAAVADNAVVLIFRVLGEPTSSDIAVLRSFGSQHSVRVMLQRDDPGGIVPLERETDGGHMWYELAEHHLRMTFGPTDFIQVNADVNRQMIALALDLLRPDPGTRMLDLFCGIGNFTLPFARRAGYVLGIEGDPSMVVRARANAQLNGIANAHFVAADLEATALRPAWDDQKFDAALLDPPRAGAAAVIRPLAESGAVRILYVSCNPGTLARDAGMLVNEIGFRLTASGILDMFPATSHVESVALFERQ
jgi:23S rRNA (uracil1939-C5)-methyltransferase